MITLLKTLHIQPKEQEFVLDASLFTFGRLCSYIASIFKGSLFNTCYSSHYGSRNLIILHNFSNIKFLGNKISSKTWYKYSGYIGGLKERKFNISNFRQQKTMLIQSIWKMMNKCSKSRKLLNNSLFIYHGKYENKNTTSTCISNITYKKIDSFVAKHDKIINSIIEKAKKKEK